MLEGNTCRSAVTSHNCGRRVKSAGGERLRSGDCNHGLALVNA